MSVNPLCLSGIGLSDFDNSSKESRSTVSSSVFVLNKIPLTPMISPKSKSLASSNFSFSLFLDKKICNLPELSSSVIKAALPITRFRTILPAVHMEIFLSSSELFELLLNFDEISPR